MEIIAQNTAMQVRKSGNNFYVEYKGDSVRKIESWCVFRADTERKAMNFFNKAAKSGNY